MANKNGN